MANNLRRDIEDNEVVLIKWSWFKKEFRNRGDDFRAFVAQDGFGMRDQLRGYAIGGYFLADGEQTRIEGFDIDAAATKRWQKEHGKFPPAKEEQPTA